MADVPLTREAALLARLREPEATRFYSPSSVISIDIRGGPYAEFDNLSAAYVALAALVEPPATDRPSPYHEAVEAAGGTFIDLSKGGKS